MKSQSAVGPILVIAALAVVGYFGWQYWSASNRAQLAESPGASPSDQPDAPAQPAFPIEGVAVAPEADAPVEPLPDLAESDSAALDALAGVIGQEQPPAVILGEHIVERIVVSIDNLTRRQLPSRGLPVRTADGPLLTATDPSGVTVIDERNFARYADYMALVEAFDVDAAVAQYVRAYPLFQQAYRELGYPDRHFNDRLVAVIDHLLAAPTPNLPIALVPEKAGYTYADPALHSASAGHKMLIRIGPDNAAVVKAKLRALRDALAGQAPLAEPAGDDAPAGEEGTEAD